ncbi:hypothetical protein CW751_01935 [Brumimicrobium salinarum]|uniref:Uncharacterized protein n=1 Tax=Brumimicrobium salinarum TaxID=2058658 RepID=A0A2I0R6B8_9FLAO|nr:hypothetical protein [Brumimicrobium salinarum]PKR82121.1 hypothetical protein CW751_01935 [Brumimicrobium salinarum]
MKKIIFSTFLTILIAPLFAQNEIEVTPGKFPFEEIVEWPGKGTLILGSDPTERTSEINFSLLDIKGEIAWNRSVYPKSENTHLIVSGMSDYIYFVDDLEPVKNKIRYNQVNQSGSITPTKFDLLAVIRSYKYTTPSDLIVKEIVNTPKSLVFHLQLPVKDKGIFENFFVSITHHNNRVYHYQGPVSDMDLLKDGKESELIFEGADENRISFSRYEFSDGKNHTRSYSFTPKAEPIARNTITLKKFDPIVSTFQNVSLNGSYYIDQENNSRREIQGKGLFLEGKYFYLVNDQKERCLKIYGLNEDGEYVVLNECTNPAEESRRYKANLTIVPMKHRVIIHSTIDDKSSSFELTSSGVKVIPSFPLNIDLLQKNPSSFKVENKSTKFVHFIDNVPYFYDSSKIGKGNKVIFKQ